MAGGEGCTNDGVGDGAGDSVGFATCVLARFHHPSIAAIALADGWADILGCIANITRPL
ncbi:MAG: hypothetical protein MJE68_30645 [Proteobacteria bacterium]|nr:hypothetical protein [Pseudomonadota bacterium]